jgi:hypothetical protein
MDFGRCRKASLTLTLGLRLERCHARGKPLLLGLAHRLGLLAYQESGDPHLLSPRPRSGSLATVYSEPSCLICEPVGHGL